MSARSGLLLLIDDEEKILKTLGRALREAGHDVVATADIVQARGVLRDRAVDILLVDHLMPEMSGIDFIRDYLATTPAEERAQVLMMTAHATVSNAIEAMKLGAFDYLQKPFEIDELLLIVDRALELQRLRTDRRYLLSERDERFDSYGIVGDSAAIRKIMREAEIVAGTKSTVLIMGETGTGKELVARAIPCESARRTSCPWRSTSSNATPARCAGPSKGSPRMRRPC